MPWQACALENVRSEINKQSSQITSRSTYHLYIIHQLLCVLRTKISPGDKGKCHRHPVLREHPSSGGRQAGKQVRAPECVGTLRKSAVEVESSHVYPDRGALDLWVLRTHLAVGEIEVLMLPISSKCSITCTLNMKIQ